MGWPILVRRPRAREPPSLFFFLPSSQSSGRRTHGGASGVDRYSHNHARTRGTPEGCVSRFDDSQDLSQHFVALFVLRGAKTSSIIAAGSFAPPCVCLVFSIIFFVFLFSDAKGGKERRGDGGAAAGASSGLGPAGVLLLLLRFGVRPPLPPAPSQDSDKRGDPRLSGCRRRHKVALGSVQMDRRVRLRSSRNNRDDGATTDCFNRERTRSALTQKPVGACCYRAHLFLTRPLFVCFALTTD